MPFEITVKVESDNKLVISWVPFDTVDMDHRKFLGYQVFYKEVQMPHTEISIYENRTVSGYEEEGGL